MKIQHLRIAAAGVVASRERRTIAGTVVTYGEEGHTSIGPLRTKAGALRWGPGTHVNGDLTRLKLTREHDRGDVRGHTRSLEDSTERLYATVKVADGATGDAALAEAGDHTRDAFSFDVIDATVEDGWLIDGELLAIGQVGIPAYSNSRIDSVAAQRKVMGSMTEEQRVRLAELRAKQNLTPDETSELSTLAALEEAEDAGDTPADEAPPAPPAEAAAGLTINVNQGGAAPRTVPVAASSVPLVPGGAHRPPTRTTKAGALDRFVKDICAALRPGGGGAAAITAALTDVTNTSLPGDAISMPAWSGELWSGVGHEQEFVPLLNSGPLTNYEGKGWRFVTKPIMQDYAGDKGNVPSGAVTTEPSTYEAARMAVGHDIDRKFYDFPDEAFLRAYVEAVRESWSIKLDGKVEAWIDANATASGITGTTLFGVVGKLRRAVKRAKMGKATFVMVADEDYDTLLDVTNNNAPAYLELFGIDPNNWVSSDALTAGEVVVGNRLAATVRTLPGSPIRVSAQHIAQGGIDEAFFGYYAIEEHNVLGIQKGTFDATP